MSSTKFRSPKRASLAAGAALALAAPVVANAAQNIYLEIPGLPGDSTATGIPDLKSEFNVLAWAWGSSNSSTAAGTAGKASVQDLSVTKYFSAGSPAIFRAVAVGESFSSATLRVYAPATGTSAAQLLWVILMTKVIITSESTGTSSAQTQITENVTLNFETITITDQLTGAKDCFNSVTNSTC